MKQLMQLFLLLTFFAFSANLVQKIVWAEKTENVAENDDSDDSDDTDNEEKRERTEWFAELPSFDYLADQDCSELTATGFPDLSSELPEVNQNQLKSPPECMC